jgi:hypothetical protein
LGIPYPSRQDSMNKGKRPSNSFTREVQGPAPLIAEIPSVSHQRIVAIFVPLENQPGRTGNRGKSTKSGRTPKNPFQQSPLDIMILKLYGS